MCQSYARRVFGSPIVWLKRSGHSGPRQVSQAVCVRNYFCGIGWVPITTGIPYFSGMNRRK